MKREIDLKEISDGKVYTSRDMVRVGCEDCKGCSSCCRGMGNSIVLDPIDIYRMISGLGGSFDQLLDGKIELNIVDGIILPNLKMSGDKGACPFLDENGRCSIHRFRPGICRLFPLGRVYENGEFRYFLQVHECKKAARTKVKISKWLDMPNLKQYEQFVKDWHYFLLEVEKEMSQTEDIEKRKQTGMGLLTLFYRKPYDLQRDFYIQFYERLNLVADQG